MNGSPFFVSGIPRTRTAWLANLLTTDKSFCGHDSMKDGVSAENLAAKLAENKASILGESSSALLQIAAEAVKLFPDARWVLVNSETERAVKSYRRWFSNGREYPGVPAGADIGLLMNLAQECYRVARSVIPANNLLEVRFHDLENEATVKNVWKWLLPSIEWSEARYRLLDRLAVNVHPKKIN